MRVGITGISGSLGTALTARLVEAGIGPIVGVTRDEFRAEQISQKYGGIQGNVRVMVVAEGINNQAKLTEVFRGCEVIIHAAALKRISGSVYAAEEMTVTNIFGTLSVLKAATLANVQKVIVVSSDKACEPTTLYGSTKHVAECLAVQENSFSYPRGMRISAVRYGNVVSSRGSVIPIWKEAFAKGEQLKITHKDMTRFQISMNQAVDFIMACLFSMKGGEVFVPILPSARMYDVALAICDDQNRITILDELRPGGEKLSEILLSQEEPRRTVSRKLCGGFGAEIDSYVILPGHRSWSNEPYPGIPIPIDTVYRSDTNHWKLSLEEIKCLI